VRSVTISPDGASAYAASFSSNAVAIFDRNPTTGALTQKPGTAGCISETGTAGACVDGTALDGAVSVTVSPDGTSAYVASLGGDAVAIFDRDTPPQTTIDSGPSGLTNDNEPTFGFSSSEAGSSFECKVDGGTFDPCSGPGATHKTFALADGSHAFQVRAVDPAANVDPTPASRTFTVDTTPPETEITKKPKKKVKTTKGKAKIKVSFKSEAGATFECKLDKGSFKPCDSPFSVKAKSKPGKGKKHAISVQATDAAGNVESKPAKATFRLIRKG
jgi:DNA-binding beta-propeller fold protein YncE